MESLIGIGVSSFLIGLSGAMMPGPVLTVTIGQTVARLRGGGGSGRGLAAWPPAIRGALVGPLVVLGHGLLEACLVVGLALGLGSLLAQGPVVGTIGLVGGGVLLWMGWGMLRGARLLSLPGPAEAEAAGRHPVLAGILTTLANPYWTLWWATIGLGYIAVSLRVGPSGLVAFYAGHVLSDLAWYGLVSLSLALGRRLVTDRVYRGLVAACALLLVGFGLYFGYAGVQTWLA